jgi:hypothetical protein
MVLICLSSNIVDSILSEFIDHKLRVRLVSLACILFFLKQCPAFYDTKRGSYVEFLSRAYMSQE